MYIEWFLRRDEMLEAGSAPKSFQVPVHTTNEHGYPNLSCFPRLYLRPFLSLSPGPLRADEEEWDREIDLIAKYSRVTSPISTHPRSRLCAVIERRANAQRTRLELVVDLRKKDKSGLFHQYTITISRAQPVYSTFLLKVVTLFDPSNEKKKFFFPMENNQALVLQEHFYFDLSSTNLWNSMC